MSRIRAKQFLTLLPSIKLFGATTGQLASIGPFDVDTGRVFAVQTLTCQAASAMTQAEYVIIWNAEFSTNTAFWFDIDSNGTPPTGGEWYNPSAEKYMVSILSSDTAEQVALKLKAKIKSGTILTTDAETTNVSNVITLTHNIPGPISFVAKSYNQNESGAGSITPARPTQGAFATLMDKYFFFSSSTTDYYFWFDFNLNGTDPVYGADPEIPGRTGIGLTLRGDETTAEVITLVSDEINNNSSLTTDATATLVEFLLEPSDFRDVDTGATVTQYEEIKLIYQAAYTAVSAYKVNPDLFE